MRAALLLIPLLSAQITVRDEAAARAEYAQSVAAVGEILRMAREANALIDKSDPHTLPADGLKMLSEIQKQAKAVRMRLKR